MGAVESLQATSFHEFKLFGTRGDPTDSTDSMLATGNMKGVKSATVCLSDSTVGQQQYLVDNDSSRGKHGLCVRLRHQDKMLMLRETASMPHLPSVIEQIHNEEKEENNDDYDDGVVPQCVEQVKDGQKQKRSFTAAAFQRLTRMARSRRSKNNSRRHSSGSVESSNNSMALQPPLRGGDTNEGGENVVVAGRSFHRRPKSLPNLIDPLLTHDVVNHNNSADSTLSVELPILDKRNLEWLALDPPHTAPPTDDGRRTRLPEIETGAFGWDGSSVTLSDTSPSVDDGVDVDDDNGDEAVADYMYLTACADDTHTSHVRRWWPRRVMPVQNMQFMPRLHNSKDPLMLQQQRNDICSTGGDYWDVLSRCSMRPTSSLALASLREMVEHTTDNHANHNNGSVRSSCSSSSESSSSSSTSLSIDNPHAPHNVRGGGRVRAKRVLSEPMQYILYNSYLRYYGPPDKANS